MLSALPVAVSSSSAADDSRYADALKEIYGRLNYETTPDAARTVGDFQLTLMQDLLIGLGSPQLSVPTVHVAGSKGKGSTSTMVARIAEAAGYRVGLFTSPHIDSFEERFTINGELPTHRQIADLYEQLKAVIEVMRRRHAADSPTFFEIATAMAWLHFAEQKVDLAVMEVGLGGRLDSTNICNPLVSCIASISRDHTRLLGNTLALIAREKAGIIKPNVPMVTATAEGEAGQVIAEIAAEQHAPLYRLGFEFQHAPQPRPQQADSDPPCYQFDFQGLKNDFSGLQVSMPGIHQTQNGALAVAITLLLRERDFEIPENAIRQGLLQASCPLRVEVLSHAPLTIVDAAHNPASIAALCESLRHVRLNRRIVIFASSRDKEADALLKILNESMDEIWLTRFSNNPRSIGLDDLEQLARQQLTHPYRIFPTLPEALAEARRTAGPEDLICITGSFFLAAEAKTLLSRP